MIASIRNGHLSIEVESMGAELFSLRDLVFDREWLWQGDERYWRNRSPVLFPIVGRVVDDTYMHQGARYKLGGHGFALGREFELVERKADRLVHRLTSDARTREVYPFDFVLDVSHQLDGAVLKVGFEVRNTGAGAMLFSVGGHPGFNTERMEEHYLEFEKKESIDRRMHPIGVLDGTTRPFLSGDQVVPLTHGLFRDGAVVLCGLSSRWVTLASRTSDRKVRVTFADLPYLGIWSPVTPSPFVCIEPWHGVPSTKGDSPELSAKEGILTLAARGRFRCGYEIEPM